MNQLSKKRSEAGRAGGLTTLARHGVDHFKRIGAKGARVFHLRYRLEPVYLNDFAIVKRETGEAVAFVSGKPWE